MKNQILERAKEASSKIISNSAYTKELKERRRHNRVLFRGMYLHEVFHFFEEIICKPIFGGEEFTIHASDINEGGKFEEFALYSIGKFSDDFQCLVYLG